MDDIALRETYKTLKKNQDYLHFHIRVVQNTDGKFYIQNDVEEKYQKPLQKLINQCAVEALKLGISLIDLNEVEEKDQDTVKCEWTELFERYKGYFITILFRDGVDMYLTSILSAAQHLNISYFLKHIQPEIVDDKITWRGPCDSRFEDGVWKNKKGEIRTDPISWEKALVF